MCLIVQWFVMPVHMKKRTEHILHWVHIIHVTQLPLFSWYYRDICTPFICDIAAMLPLSNSTEEKDWCCFSYCSTSYFEVLYMTNIRVCLYEAQRAASTVSIFLLQPFHGKLLCRRCCSGNECIELDTANSAQLKGFDHCNPMVYVQISRLNFSDYFHS